MELLPDGDISGRENAYLMEAVALHSCHNVEGPKVWVATVVDKPALISEVGCVHTQREEIIIVALLNLYIILIAFV